jgi:hypothetical protein
MCASDRLVRAPSARAHHIAAHSLSYIKAHYIAANGSSYAWAHYIAHSRVNP